MLYLGADLCTNVTGLATNFLGDEEIRYLDSIVSIKRRTQFLAGRVLVRRLLCRTHGGQMSDWSLSARPGIKPVVRGAPDIHVSISHSAGRVVCGLSDRPVGVDIETVKPERDVRALGEMCLHPDECRRLDDMAMGNQARRFTELWTIKEAWIKRAGSGLDLPRMRRLYAEPCTQNGEAQAVTLYCRDGVVEQVVAVVSSRLEDLNIEGDGCVPERWQLLEGH